VIASEDVGLAYPMAAVLADACVNSAMRLGMPEASIPLSNLTVALATAPKSNSAHEAYERAAEDFRNGKGQDIPSHLREVTKFKRYKYPHSYPDHYVEQQYLPNDLKDVRYYEFGANKNEQAARLYWETIKDKNKK